MTTQDIMQKLGLFELDAITAKEIAVFLERKLDEQARIKGQIARDLARIGEMAFLDPKAYDKLKAKYKANFFAAKKRAILENMRNQYCRRHSHDKK